MPYQNREMARRYGLILITLCAQGYILASMEWSNNDLFDYEVKVQAYQIAYMLLSETTLSQRQRDFICVP